MNPILTTVAVVAVTISIFATSSCRNVSNPTVETPAEKAFRELPKIIEQSPTENYQYVHKIRLKFKNGLVSRVSYDELRFGVGKRNNVEYCQ